MILDKRSGDILNGIRHTIHPFCWGRLFLCRSCSLLVIRKMHQTNPSTRSSRANHLPATKANIWVCNRKLITLMLFFNSATAQDAQYACRNYHILWNIHPSCMCMVTAAHITSRKSSASPLGCGSHYPVDMHDCLLSDLVGTPHCSASDCRVYLRLHFRVCMVLALDSWTQCLGTDSRAAC
jgi:hypothetical protein